MMRTYQVTIVAHVTTESFRDDEGDDPIEWDHVELLDNIKNSEHVDVDSIELRTNEKTQKFINGQLREIVKLKTELAKVRGAQC